MINVEKPSELGINVWWTVPSIVADAENTRSLLEKHGFSPELITAPSRRLEVTRAARSLQNRRGAKNRRVTEKTQDNGTYVVFGILGRKRVNEESVRFKQNTTIRLNKETDEVTVEGELANDFRGALDMYAGKITDDEIRDFLRYVIREAKGISKRPSGGIYFVPTKYVDIIERAHDFLADMEVGAKIYAEGLINGVRERENVWEAAEEEIQMEIDSALRATERIEKSANAVKGHQMKLESLEELVGVYQKLLGEEAKYEAVTERIEEAVQTVQAKMGKLQKATLSAAMPQMA